MPCLRPNSRDDLLDLGIGGRRSRLRVVHVVAAAVLLAAPAALAQALAHRRRPSRSLPSNRRRGRRDRSWRTGPWGSRSRRAPRSTCAGLAPSRIRRSASLPRRRQHAVADEAVADADQHRRPCRCVSPMAIAVAMTSFERLVAAHDLEQPHDVGRAEEVHADHALGPRWSPTAISLTSSAEVLVASTAPGLGRSRRAWRRPPS